MTTYQAFNDFTAHGKSVSALMNLYTNLEKSGAKTIELTPIVVFLAFSIEGYLNSLGARHVLVWDELERLPWKNKIKILYKTAGKEPAWGKDPLQFTVELFRIRDKLAHGKPERVLGPKVRDNEPVEVHKLQPDWYKSITKEWVLEAKERFRLLMIDLGTLFNEHESDHLLQATGGVLVDDGSDA